MKQKIIHTITLFLLLITSISIVLDSFSRSAELENYPLEQIDSEMEIDDLEVEIKKTVFQDNLSFLSDYCSRMSHHIKKGNTTLEYFEKIPTPPPEV